MMVTLLIFPTLLHKTEQPFEDGDFKTELQLSSYKNLNIIGEHILTMYNMYSPFIFLRTKAP
jgi:hypothetical protein